MNTGTKVYWKCPSCGYTNHTHIDLEKDRRTFDYCGGCERTMAVVVQQVWAEAYDIPGINK